MSSIIRATTTSGLQIAPDNSGSLVLQTNGTTTAVTIDTSQNVGIGTTSPARKLDVRVSGTGNVANFQSNAGPNISFTGTETSGRTYLIGEGLVTAGNFSVYDNNASAERFVIDSSGNVLINKTSQSNTGKLEIDYSRATHAGSNYNETSSASSCTHIAFQRGGTSVGSIQSGNNSSTTYNTSSDYRLKEDIVSMVGALDKVALLKPVTYKWKIDGSDGQGFIAHELQEIVPDCVSGEKDGMREDGTPDYQGVDTSFLVATLTAAIQEQQTIINDLKARIETLEAK